MLLAGASWCGEYGNPDEGDFEKFMHQYSPYQKLCKEDVDKYPTIFMTTSTRDDRVHPGIRHIFVCNAPIFEFQFSVWFSCTAAI